MKNYFISPEIELIRTLRFDIITGSHTEQDENDFEFTPGEGLESGKEIQIQGYGPFRLN